MSEPSTAGRAPANDFFPPFSGDEMRARHARVQQRMGERGLDALVVWGAFAWGTSPGQFNASWLSNYAGVGHSLVVLPAEGAPTQLISTVPHLRNARALAPGIDFRADPNLPHALAERLRELAPRRIGIVGPYGAMSGLDLPDACLGALRAACPAAEVEIVTEWFERFQLLKSDEELELLRRAGRLGDEIYAQLLAATRPGVSDAALRRVIAHACIDAGATHPFSHIGSFAAADPDDCYPDFYPTHTPVAAGDVLQTELCVGFGNYWNKIWGTWFTGRPPQVYLEMHALARELHDAVIADLRAGLACADIERHAQRAVAAGYELQLPLVMGWSALNHGPLAGAVAGSRWSERAAHWREAAFEARQTVTVACWLSVPGTRQGLWLGTSGAVTTGGFERFNGALSTQLNIV